MVQLEAFQEFRAGLVMLRGGHANDALPHLRFALEHEPDNPYYISYVGVAVAAAEQKCGQMRSRCAVRRSASIGVRPSFT